MHDSRAHMSHDDYLVEVERLARAVVDEAAAERWLTFFPEKEDQTALQHSIIELARSLRYTHHDGDGCLGH